MKSSPTRKQKLHVKPIHKVPAAHLPRPVAAGPSLPSLSLATGDTKVLRHVTETRNIHTEPREVMGLHGVFFLSFCSTSSSQCHRCAGSGSCAAEEMHKPLGTQLLPPRNVAQTRRATRTEAMWSIRCSSYVPGLTNTYVLGFLDSHYFTSLSV